MRTSTDFELFFKENYTHFYFFAFHILEDEEACRDIVSDSFEYVWHNYRTLDVANWRNYIYSYIRNKCVDYIRHQEVQKRYADFYMQLMQEEQRLDEADCERLDQIKEVMADLPSPIQTVLHENFMNGKTYKEIAAEAGVSESMIKKRMAKAICLIRDRIAKKYK